MESGLSDSRFNMWRAVFSLIHADGVVSSEEIVCCSRYMDEVAFSTEQRVQLLQDISRPRDIEPYFNAIQDNQDVHDFFVFARSLVWCDGNLDMQEAAILERLQLNYKDGNQAVSYLKDTREDERLKICRGNSRPKLLEIMKGIFRL